MEIRITIEVMHPTVVGTVIDSEEVLVDAGPEGLAPGGSGDIEEAVDRIIERNQETF